ncbi:toxin Cry1Ac domain D-VI-related protein [Listeria booriae]|uniref:toxin Cry1Ac domain D-VI-related protein n=1 Tax=Listeria booriae TaxID=1552123 RepID=UPI001625E416|nr:toxin Cry1Ac domain D-VI-related protein [Listeria booriae]MBC2170441.1 hypothetical protein [Listeria booriae]MBC2173434.1 hypothetical protein [Listeria booriae]MBC2195881.1 hypothetical protein [Listeria booriae]MBC2326995.1 hypothetical protein [Listeria booriae]
MTNKTMKNNKFAKKAMTVVAATTMITSVLATPISAFAQEMPYKQTAKNGDNVSLLKTPIEKLINTDLTFDTVTKKINNWNMLVDYEPVDTSTYIRQSNGKYYDKSPLDISYYAAKPTSKSFLVGANRKSQNRYNGIYQEVNTVIGKEYKFSVQVKTVEQTWTQQWGNDGRPIIQISNSKNIASPIFTYDTFTALNAVRTVTKTFTATASKTYIFLGVRTGTGGDNNYTAAEYWNPSVTTYELEIPVINRVTNHDTVVKGKAQPRAKISLNTRYEGIGAYRLYESEVDNDGNYEIIIPTQPVGSKISVEQSMEGETSELAVTTVMDADLYTPPTIVPVTSSDTIVRGTATEGATVEVKIGENTYTAVAGTGGAFAVNIGTARPTGTEMTVILKGNHEKTSTPVTVTVGQSLLEMATEAVDNLFTDASHTGLAPTTDRAAIAAAQGLVNRLPIGADRNELQAEIDKANALIVAKENADRIKAAQDAVDALFSSPAHTGLATGVGQTEIDAAKALVDALPAGAAKTELLDEIAKAQALLDAKEAADKLAAAEKAVDDLFSDAGHTGLGSGVTQDDIDAAKDLVDGLPAGSAKDELLDEIAKAQDLINVQEEASKLAAAQAAVDALFTNASHTALAPGVNQAQIDAAKALVDALPAGTAKTELLEEVAKAQALLNAIPAVGEITANDFRLGTNSAVTGTYTGNVAEVQLFVNGIGKGKATVRSGAISYYAMDKIRSLSDVVELVSYDNRGNENDRKTVNILSTTPVTGTITPANFTMGTDTRVTGTFTGPVAKVGLKVNGTEIGKVGVSGGTFSYYAFRAFTASDRVEVVAYASNGAELATSRVTINGAAPSTGTVTPQGFNITSDRHVKGAVTGDVHKVALVVNAEEKGRVGIIAGEFSYYAFNVIRSASDTVQVVAYDKDGRELARQNVTVTDTIPAP